MIGTEEQTDSKYYYIDTNNSGAANDFMTAFSFLLEKKISQYKEIVILCIGTDRVTGDCLGPLIGYKLKGNLGDHFNIYGTLDEPVHAKNIEETTKKIYKKHKKPLIIAIDASLGTPEHIGFLTVGEGSIKPGAGLNKKLPHVGDIFVTGIVNLNNVLDIFILQNTRLCLVMKMADIISSGILGTLRIKATSKN